MRPSLSGLTVDEGLTLEPSFDTSLNEYAVNCPTGVDNFTFTATKNNDDDWGDGMVDPIWAEASYYDENGTLIITQAQQPPQGSSIPDTLDFDIEFDEIAGSVSAVFKTWVYSPEYLRSTEYTVTITRTENDSRGWETVPGFFQRMKNHVWKIHRFPGPGA